MKFPQLAINISPVASPSAHGYQQIPSKLFAHCSLCKHFLRSQKQLFPRYQPAKTLPYQSITRRPFLRQPILSRSSGCRFPFIDINSKQRRQSNSPWTTLTNTHHLFQLKRPLRCKINCTWYLFPLASIFNSAGVNSMISIHLKNSLSSTATSLGDRNTIAEWPTFHHQDNPLP